MAAFKHSVNFIAEHNAKGATWTAGLTQFSDMTADEFKAYVSRPMDMTRTRNVQMLPELEAPVADVDWRTKGAVTPVKNQGQCGSCWSFSTTGSTEGANFIKNGKLVSLSEQQLMDCSTAEGDHSCQGGLMDYGFEYITKNGGIDTESDYPYKARNEACNSAKASNHVVTVTGHKDVATNNDKQLEAAVAQGPVSVAIEADKSIFQNYHSGIITGTACGTQLDHGVLAVGFGADYWIVKNSWGSSWGDQGYVKIGRTTSGPGVCGIYQAASYPEAGSSVSAAAAGDYGPGPNCPSGDQDVKITGVDGDYCAPSCSSGSCPAAPTGVTARPECVVETPGSQSPSLCALICTPSATPTNGDCPDGCTCKAIQGTGICTCP
jgi:hypothetical protein